MAFYRQTYMPGYTTNDSYGSFYDSKKVSLITVPDRLKNYELDVRTTRNATSGAEYGEFLRDEGMFSRRSVQDAMQQQQQQQELQQLEQQQQQQLAEQQQQQQQQQQPEPTIASPRDLPPPVSELSYRQNVGLQRRGIREAEEAADSRLRRSQSPPPPLEQSQYAANSQRYAATHQLQQRQLQWEDQQQQQHRPDDWQEAAAELPALRYGRKEIRLPDIDAVELHMRDKSKILLNVREFYSKYLRD